MQYVVAGDLHLRSDRPRCRTDEDWMETQLTALEWILVSAQKRKCDVILTGDLFHRAVSSIELVNSVISVFLKYPDVKVFSIPGNHDLPYHSLDNIDRSAYGILQKTGVLWGGSNFFPFGTDNPETVKGFDLIAIHRLILEKDPGFHIGSDWMIAEDVLDGYPDAKWILTGDCHDSFIVTKGDRKLINPGSMLRQSAAQIEQTTHAVFIDTETGQAEWLDIPDPDTVVADYLTVEKERDDRIQAFVSQMKTGKGLGLSFEDNLELYYQNAVEDGVEISTKVINLIEEVTV